MTTQTDITDPFEYLTKTCTPEQLEQIKRVIDFEKHKAHEAGKQEERERVLTPIKAWLETWPTFEHKMTQTLSELIDSLEEKP